MGVQIFSGETQFIPSYTGNENLKEENVESYS